MGEFYPISAQAYIAILYIVKYELFSPCKVWVSITDVFATDDAKPNLFLSCF